MLDDARAFEDGARLEADVCIIGGGPAGIVLALELAAGGRSVCLLESGGDGIEHATLRLNAGRTEGTPYFRLDNSRFRVLGGSTSQWSGWCRPLDPFDFEARCLVPDSGWPITSDDLVAAGARVRPYLELPAVDDETADWADTGALQPIFTLERFQVQRFRFSPPTHVGRRYRAELAANQSIRVLLHATVTELELDSAGEQVASALLCTPRAARLRVVARRFVLAAGGIENARLLLASRARRPAGLGNGHDLVGRYFHEHLQTGMGMFRPAHAAFDSRFWGRHAGADGDIEGVLLPRHGHPDWAGRLNACVSLSAAGMRHRHLFRRTPPEVLLPMRYLHRHLWHRDASGAGRASSRAGGQELAVYLRSEQTPSAANRVVLADDRDAYGTPRATLQWRVSTADLDSMHRAATDVATDLARAGVGDVRLHDRRDAGWVERIMGGPHHMGTTRMAATERTGVVDADCRVFGVPNLFVAGCSVFPTGGYVMPTYSMLLLAVRLADHVRQDLP